MLAIEYGRTVGKTVKWSDALSTERKGGYTQEKPALRASRISPRSQRKCDAFQRAQAGLADTALLGTASLGAAVVGRFDRTAMLPPDSSSVVQSLIANNLPQLSITVEAISKGAAQSRAQIKETLCQNKSIKNVIVRVAPPSCLEAHFDFSLQSTTSLYLDRLHISTLLENPPPLLFLAACTCFALAISVFQYRHGSDRYNAQFLIVGGTIGVLLAALGREDFVMELKGYLTWSIITSLFCSSLLHRVLQLWPDPDGKDGR